MLDSCQTQHSVRWWRQSLSVVRLYLIRAFKGGPWRRGFASTIDRNREKRRKKQIYNRFQSIYFLLGLKSTFDGHENTAVSVAISCLAGCVCDFIKHKCLLRQKLIFFCSSLEKSEPAWLRPEKLKFEPQKNNNNTSVSQVIRVCVCVCVCGGEGEP